jgi:hypothetical protein
MYGTTSPDVAHTTFAVLIIGVLLVGSLRLGPPPAWISDILRLGERVARKWSELAAAGTDEFAATVRPYARSAALWMLAITGGIGGLLVHFLLTVILVGVLYAQGRFLSGAFR